MAHPLGAIELESIGASSRTPLGRTPDVQSIKSDEAIVRGTSANEPATSEEAAPVQHPRYVNTTTGILIIVQLCLVIVSTTAANGLLVIGIPNISADLGLEQSLVTWPVLIFSLTSGSFLLLAGSVADVLGSRAINLIGVFFFAIFTLACGLARNGPELIAFRALSGVANALFLPTSVSLISTNIPSGRVRNIGFSIIGVGMNLGYAIGLVIGGVFVTSVGWRVGYYLCGGLLLALLVLGLWTLPKSRRPQSNVSAVERLKTEIDWVGVALASSCLAILAYVLAQLSTSTAAIRQPQNIVLLTISLLLLPGCVFWFGRQERRGRPALIPNHLWKQLPFSAMCVMVLLAFAEGQTIDVMSSLFFQNIQQLRAIDASLRILPCVVVGFLLELGTGLVVHRVSARWLLLSTSIVSAAAPLMFALIQPGWPYWWDAFPAMLVYPLCIDVLFTVALLVVSEVFPEKDQALAGAVFNTVGQFGQSLGLAVIGVISNSVTQSESYDAPSYLVALMDGYRAAFWTAFAWMVVICVVCAFGLRKIGKVGLKRD